MREEERQGATEKQIARTGEERGREGGQETRRQRRIGDRNRIRERGRQDRHRQTSRQSGKQCNSQRRTVGTEKNGASHTRHRERDGDTWAGGRSPTGWPGREVPGERTRLPAPCPLCSTRTRPGLQEPQEVSPLSPFRPEPGQAHQVEMGPHVHAGLHGAPQHHATLPMDGVGPAGALCLRESLQPKLTLAEAEQLPPGRAQPPLYASHTPGLGVFRGLGHGVGQGPG